MPLERRRPKNRKPATAKVQRKPKTSPMPRPPAITSFRPHDVSSQIGTGRGAGRPPKLICDAATIKIIQGLGRILATQAEVGAVLGVTQAAISIFFKREPLAAAAYDIGYAQGKASFRRDLRELAHSSGAVAIFLAKNYLGMKDVQTVNLLEIDPSKLTNDQLLQLDSILAASAGPGPQAVPVPQPGSGAGGDTQTQH